MTEFFLSYGQFALRAATLLVMAVAFAGVLAAIIGGLIHRAQDQPGEHLEVTRLNDRYQEEREALEASLVDPALRKEYEKGRKAELKRERKLKKRSAKKSEPSAPSSDAPPGPGRRCVYVLDFEGDLRASRVEALRREISAVLAVAKERDEVVVRLESPGGVVHGYGLAASQLDRIRKKGFTLTICVDKVAASGGYMMACVADRILSAPFAIIGSIGVVAQVPNFHRLLKKHDVDYELFTAGEFKRTVTVFGENTEKGRQKFLEDLEDTHELFKQFVAEHRPGVDLAEVATGEIWFGRRALERRLVDEITTSDEYLAHCASEAELLLVSLKQRKSWRDKLSTGAEAALERVLLRLWDRATQAPLERR